MKNMLLIAGMLGMSSWIADAHGKSTALGFMGACLSLAGIWRVIFDALEPKKRGVVDITRHGPTKINGTCPTCGTCTLCGAGNSKHYMHCTQYVLGVTGRQEA